MPFQKIRGFICVSVEDSVMHKTWNTQWKWRFTSCSGKHSTFLLLFIEEEVTKRWWTDSVVGAAKSVLSDSAKDALESLSVGEVSRTWENFLETTKRFSRSLSGSKWQMSITIQKQLLVELKEKSPKSVALIIWDIVAIHQGVKIFSLSPILSSWLSKTWT